MIPGNHRLFKTVLAILGLIALDQFAIALSCS